MTTVQMGLQQPYIYFRGGHLSLALNSEEMSCDS